MDEGLKRFWWGSPQKNHKNYCVFFSKRGLLEFFFRGFRIPRQELLVSEDGEVEKHWLLHDSE